MNIQIQGTAETLDQCDRPGAVFLVFGPNIEVSVKSLETLEVSEDIYRPSAKMTIWLQDKLENDCCCKPYCPLMIWGLCKLFAIKPEQLHQILD